MDGYLGYVTAAAAFGGLVLGVFNAWRAFIEDRVKIRVTVSPAKRDDGVDYLNVIIVNMSKFPVAISDVALALKNGGYRRVGRRSFGLGQSIDSRRSRSLAYWLQGNQDLEDIYPEDVESCLVRTECGTKCRVAVARPDHESQTR